VAFLTPYDIANRGLQHLGAVLISTFLDNSKNAAQAGFIYDKARRAELRANPWNFSRRRAILRASPTFFIKLPVWSSSQAYAAGDIVSYSSGLWAALLANSNQTPTNGYPWIEYTGATSVPAYAAGAYYAGELTVLGSTVYLNLVNNNTASPTTWHPVFGAVANPLVLLSPLPYTTNLLPSSSKNLFALPPAYLRNMMQDPKAAGTPAQITTGGAQALDYEIEQGFLLSTAVGPIVFRFGADLQLVPWFDDLFCEALGARIGVELNETLTQSPQKAQILNGLYEEAIGKAIRVNAIEAGSTEPDGDKVDSQRGPTREKIAPQPRQQ
jgi:hypothetical protein